MALETSESPSRSMSSPFASVVSLIRLVEGEEAMAAKAALVRNVSSFMKSKPASVVLLVVPVILMSMNEVGRLFHALNDDCNAACASATDRKAGPSGLGTGFSEVFMEYFTGMLRASHFIPISLATRWP